MDEDHELYHAAAPAALAAVWPGNIYKVEAHAETFLLKFCNGSRLNLLCAPFRAWSLGEIQYSDSNTLWMLVLEWQ